MQTRYMASKLLKDRIDSDAVNGIVSDAAHGYWLDPTTLLIISSVSPLSFIAGYLVS
jgi:hypothetical protein